MAKKRTFIVIGSTPKERQTLKDLAKKYKFRSLSNFLTFSAYYYATAQEKNQFDNVKIQNEIEK